MVTLSRPRPVATLKIGAEPQLTEDLLDRLEQTLDRAETTGAVLLLRLSGAADPAHWPSIAALRLVSRWERLLRRIERAAVPLLALAEGNCSTLALELLLVADHRVAVANFTLPAPLISAPVWPGMALFRLTHQIGQARTKRLILHPAALSAVEALDFELLDHVAPDDEAAQAHVEEMLARAPLEDFAIRRRLIQDADTMSFEEALGAHLAACDRSLRRTGETEAPSPSPESVRKGM
jgi:isomerase DpgB